MWLPADIQVFMFRDVGFHVPGSIATSMTPIIAGVEWSCPALVHNGFAAMNVILLLAPIFSSCGCQVLYVSCWSTVCTRDILNGSIPDCWLPMVLPCPPNMNQQHGLATNP